MRLSITAAALLGLVTFSAYASDVDGGTPPLRVDQLVPDIGDELPPMQDLVKRPESSYPNAGDILKAMREIPAMKGTRTPPPPTDFKAPETTEQTGAVYPNADDILRAMRELPPLERTGVPVPEVTPPQTHVPKDSTDK